MEEQIVGESFTWSRARTFSFNSKAISYATTTRLHLSVHSTALPARHQACQSTSSAECLMHGAANASHCATPRPAPPRPAVIVCDGAHSVAPSAHATRTGVSGEADVVADGTHAASGVAVTEWLAATDVNAGGTGARTSAVEDGQFPGFEGRISQLVPRASCSQCTMMTLTSPLFSKGFEHIKLPAKLLDYFLRSNKSNINQSLQNAAHGDSSTDKSCDGVDRGVIHARLHDDAQSNDDEDGPVDTLQAILGRMSPREDGLRH